MFSLKKLSHLQHLILLCNDIKYCLVKLKTIINGPVDSVDNVDEYSEINLKKKKQLSHISKRIPEIIKGTSKTNRKEGTEQRMCIISNSKS